MLPPPRITIGFGFPCLPLCSSSYPLFFSRNKVGHPHPPSILLLPPLFFWHSRASRQKKEGEFRGSMTQKLFSVDPLPHFLSILWMLVEFPFRRRRGQALVTCCATKSERIDLDRIRTAGMQHISCRLNGRWTTQKGSSKHSNKIGRKQRNSRRA